MEPLCRAGGRIPSGKLLLNHVRCKQLLLAVTELTIEPKQAQSWNLFGKRHRGGEGLAEFHFLNLDSHQG